MGHGRQEDEAKPSRPPRPPGPDRTHLPVALTSMYSGSEVPLGHRHSSTSSCPKCTSVLVVRRPRPVCSSQDSCTAVPVSLPGRSWASEGALQAQGVSPQAPALGLYRTWLQGQALWKRGRRWWKSRELKGPSLAASNSAKKWVVRSGGPEDGAGVSSKVRVMPPKVIFSSESGRMVSGWGVRAVLPEGTEASPGAPQSSRAQLDCGSGRTLGQAGVRRSVVMPRTEPKLNSTLSRELEGLEVTGSTQPST